jgi:meromycolic acid enoyl-[acyl-carrier-protein] reductase
LLSGKRILVTGVVTRRSIAFAVAEKAQELGADVLLTGFGRSRRMTERAGNRLSGSPEVIELDVNSPADIGSLAERVGERWDGVDGVLHAIAFAPEDALGGNFLSTPPESAELAFRTSAFSFKELAGSLEALLTPGASLVGLDFDASVAWPVYDWMGVSKAALEAVSRYLARDLGPRSVRVNLISAGPIDTVAAGGIPGFDDLAAIWRRQAPLGWDPGDPYPVAEVACFLLSDASRGMSGEILHVDGGFHAVGAAPVNA